MVAAVLSYPYSDASYFVSDHGRDVRRQAVGLRVHKGVVSPFRHHSPLDYSHLNSVCAPIRGDKVRRDDVGPVSSLPGSDHNLHLGVRQSVRRGFRAGVAPGIPVLSGTHKVVLIRRWPLSAPVLFGGLFFGAMHVVLWTKMGPLAIVPMILATGLGVVTGYYREKTGSLIPGVLIHGLFNIGGSLPLWILLAWTT